VGNDSKVLGERKKKGERKRNIFTRVEVYIFTLILITCTKINYEAGFSASSVRANHIV